MNDCCHVSYLEGVDLLLYLVHACLERVPLGRLHLEFGGEFGDAALVGCYLGVHLRRGPSFQLRGDLGHQLLLLLQLTVLKPPDHHLICSDALQNNHTGTRPPIKTVHVKSLQNFYSMNICEAERDSSKTFYTSFFFPFFS